VKAPSFFIMAFSNNIYCGAYLHLKTDKSWWDLTEECGFTPQMENQLTLPSFIDGEDLPKGNLYLIDNVSHLPCAKNGSVFYLEVDILQDYKNNFGDAHGNIISLLEDKLGVENVEICFGCLNYQL
jgi:hypothetical protein